MYYDLLFCYRIRILLFFQEFVLALIEKVVDQLRQNETSHQPEKWMADLAISSVHLKEGNTFARSVWLHLVDKVAGHLSRVIATCDFHSGLNHLREVGWSRNHFVRMINLVDLDTKAASHQSIKYFYPSISIL